MSLGYEFDSFLGALSFAFLKWQRAQRVVSEIGSNEGPRTRETLPALGAVLQALTD